MRRLRRFPGCFAVLTGSCRLVRPGWLLALLPAVLGIGQADSSRLEIPGLAIPARSPQAITGSEFASRTSGFTGAERQRAAVQELMAGNMPDSVRNLKPVHLTYTPPGGPKLEATVWVMPDYLAIGSDEDFLRIPLTYPSAITVARAFGAVLPTRKIVDQVYEQAECRLRPESMRPGPEMRSSEYFLTHQKKIEAQRMRLGCPEGALLAGHKKDVVITNRLLKQVGHIAIYGWHRDTDEPIQPLSTVHGARYADYSHGVRLVSQDMEINGEMVSIFEVARDPSRAPLLTREGVLSRLRRLLGME